MKILHNISKRAVLSWLKLYTTPFLYVNCSTKYGFMFRCNVFYQRDPGQPIFDFTDQRTHASQHINRFLISDFKNHDSFRNCSVDRQTKIHTPKSVKIYNFLSAPLRELKSSVQRNSDNDRQQIPGFYVFKLNYITIIIIDFLSSTICYPCLYIMTHFINVSI